MTEGFIEMFNTFNTKLCTYELFFGDFHDQPFPPEYYDLLNDNDGNENNIIGTPVDDVFLDNKGVEYSVISNAPDNDANDKDFYYDTVIDNAYSLTWSIDPLKDEIL